MSHLSSPIPALAVVLAAATLAPSSLHAQAAGPAPLETVRNFQRISDRLASAGQIGYDQIPLLGEQAYEVVVNLAVADADRNGEEGFRVAREGLTYVHIPVDWEAPRVEDVGLFFDVMEASEGRKVFVHCFANMRASAFVYLYRTLVQGVPEEDARATMNEVWDPWETDAWADLIRRARETYGG